MNSVKSIVEAYLEGTVKSYDQYPFISKMASKLEVSTDELGEYLANKTPSDAIDAAVKSKFGYEGTDFYGKLTTLTSEELGLAGTTSEEFDEVKREVIGKEV